LLDTEPAWKHRTRLGYINPLEGQDVSRLAVS